jgi:carbamoyltransferase
MYILGLNSLYHESCACLLADGRLVAAAEEERFNRVKHAKKPRLDNPHALPLAAMHYCLETAGIDLAGVDHVGFSSDPEALARVPDHSGWGCMRQFVNNTRRVPEVLRVLGFTGQFHWVGHHAAHAASAYYASPFEDAAVLTLDGIGDDSTSAWFHGQGPRLPLLRRVPAPSSLGFLWELVSMFLGFDIYDATKIMGLAAYGDPARFAAPFQRLVQLLPDGGFETDHEALRFWLLDYEKPTGYFAGLERLLQVRRRTPPEELTQAHRDVAAALQQVTDATVTHMVAALHRCTGSPNLCLAGGVALNCLTNRQAFEAGPFTGLFVQPAAHDAGTGVGAAFFIWHHLLGRDRQGGMEHAFHGPEFTAAEIENALRAAGLTYTRPAAIEPEVARLLSQQAVVGYFQGRMEIGPRALGNRSLLTDPRNPHARQMLNEKVKHREYFRPFAPSVLHEEAKAWFRIEKDTAAAEFMLMAYPIREPLRDRVPAVIHVDGTSRIQTVRREANPRYHSVISEFFRLTGVPMVLNTSFNDSEPIVCSPADAIDTFLKTDIDYLAVGDFLVSKADNRGAARLVCPPQPVDLRRVFPRVHGLLDTALAGRQVGVVDGILVATDALDCRRPDRVLALLPEHQFFLDELDRQKLHDARVLDLAAGSGVLSIAAVRAGAAQVVALEVHPRARALAGFNIVLNGCEDRIEIREGNADFFAPVAGQRFDYLMANPPFTLDPPAGASPRDTSAGAYGLHLVEAIFAQLDRFLTEHGHAQIVAFGPGDKHGPFLLAELARQRLSGTTRIKANAEPFRLGQTRGPRGNRVSHLYLCVVHYDRGVGPEVTVEPAAKRYPDWHATLPSNVRIPG